MQEEILNKLTNRHLAKLLDFLDEIRTPNITKEIIKREIWFLNDDIKTQVLNNILSKEQVDGRFRK